MVNIFIYRRDLRTYDNNGLYDCLKDGKTVPIFILNPEQLDLKRNSYASERLIKFMTECLRDLDKELKKVKSKLYLFYGEEEKVLNNILENENIDNIYFNHDFTPFAKKRDNNIINLVQKYNKKSKNKVNVISVEDYTLLPMGTVMTGDKSAYKVYTPFYRKSMKYFKDIKKPKKYSLENLDSFKNVKKLKYIFDIKNIDKFYSKKNTMNNIFIGGRNNAIKKLKNVNHQDEYSKKRNILTYKTTHLSSYIKFGCVSIREVFYVFEKYLNKKNTLFSQLFWREFYVYIINYYPEVISKSSDFQSKYSKVKWKYDKTLFNKWKNGETGFPIVDACMRELNNTGYMHNRGRLIVSSFLIKLCMIDWRLGEKYFAQNLIDYDPAQNNGGWQFHHGGASNADYFRILSPVSQGKRFDKNADYIKKWLPMLKDIPAGDLLDWENNYKKYDLKKIKYFKPFFEYKKRRELSLSNYKKAFS